MVRGPDSFRPINREGGSFKVEYGPQEINAAGKGGGLG